MAKKRGASRRKINKTPVLGIIGLILLLSVSIGATVYFLFLRPGTTNYPRNDLSAAPHEATKATPDLRSQNVIKKEIPPVLPISEPQPVVEERMSDSVAELLGVETVPEAEKEMQQEAVITGPMVAIIIDDIGDKKKIAEKFIDSDFNLNFSILPHTPYGTKLSKRAKAKGREVLLHLPMEATDPKWNPGPGAIFVKMGKADVQSTMEKALSSVPLASGINNHMGSRYTENEKSMNFFLTEVKARGLYFIDSLTSSKSLGYQMAQQLEIQSHKRDVFLDNEKDTEKIIKQIRLLVKIAEKHGRAIGIGHPYPATFEAIKSSRSLLSDNITLVSVSQLL